MKWLNEPASWQRTGDVLSVSVDPGTDFWRETGYGYVHDSGHVYGEEHEGDVDVSVRVRGAFASQYDQAGVMLRIEERVWLKAGVEFFEGRPRLSTVLTLGRSSWMVADLPGRFEEVTLRASRRGDAVEVRYMLDDGPPELAALVYLPPDREVLAGIMCAAPEGPGFRVSFRDLRIERGWSARLAKLSAEPYSGAADPAAGQHDAQPWPEAAAPEANAGWPGEPARNGSRGWAYTPPDDPDPGWSAASGDGDGAGWLPQDHDDRGGWFGDSGGGSVWFAETSDEPSEPDRHGEPDTLVPTARAADPAPGWAGEAPRGSGLVWPGEDPGAGEDPDEAAAAGGQGLHSAPEPAAGADGESGAAGADWESGAAGADWESGAAGADWESGAGGADWESGPVASAPRLDSDSLLPAGPREENGSLWPARPRHDSGPLSPAEPGEGAAPEEAPEPTGDFGPLWSGGSGYSGEEEPPMADARTDEDAWPAGDSPEEDSAPGELAASGGGPSWTWNDLRLKSDSLWLGAVPCDSGPLRFEETEQGPGPLRSEEAGQESGPLWTAEVRHDLAPQAEDKPAASAAPAHDATANGEPAYGEPAHDEPGDDQPPEETPAAGGVSVPDLTRESSDDLTLKWLADLRDDSDPLWPKEPSHARGPAAGREGPAGPAPAAGASAGDSEWPESRAKGAAADWDRLVAGTKTSKWVPPATPDVGDGWPGPPLLHIAGRREETRGERPEPMPERPASWSQPGWQQARPEDRTEPAPRVREAAGPDSQASAAPREAAGALGRKRRPAPPPIDLPPPPDPADEWISLLTLDRADE